MLTVKIKYKLVHVKTDTDSDNGLQTPERPGKN